MQYYFLVWYVCHSFAARPGFNKGESCTSSVKSHLEPIPLTDKGLLPDDFVLEDPDSHFIYVCIKSDETELSNMPNYPLAEGVL